MKNMKIWDFGFGISDLIRLMAVACFLLPAASQVYAADNDVMKGVLADVSGDVELQKRGSPDFIPASNGMSVMSGDQISTGIDGKATIKFQNSSTSIEPLTQFIVGRAVETDKEFYTELFLSVGKVTSKVDKDSGKKNRFSVTTPTAVAGVRGTTLECEYFPATGSEMKASDGEGYSGDQKPAEGSAAAAAFAPPKEEGKAGMRVARQAAEQGAASASEKALAVAPPFGAPVPTGEPVAGLQAPVGEPVTVAGQVADFNTFLNNTFDPTFVASFGDVTTQDPTLVDASTLVYVYDLGGGDVITVDATGEVAPPDVVQQEAAVTVVLSEAVKAFVVAEVVATTTTTAVVDAPITAIPLDPVPPPPSDPPPSPDPVVVTPADVPPGPPF